jgi:tricorn protease
MKKKLLAFLCLLCTYSTQAAESPLWMTYPSISPDGKTIVFTYKGDLYRVASEGGTAIPLTLHESHDYMPVWSPDGKWIAFASDRYGNFDVFVMPAEGGQAKRLTHHSAADYPSDFTPDGKEVIFSSARMDASTNVQFPSGVLPELYKVAAAGGRTSMALTTPAEMATYSQSGDKLVYHDRKGYEDPFRKHHTSSVARDIWVYDVKTQRHTQITTYEGEDRNPVLAANGEDLYYLSEKGGTFNVFKTNIKTPGQAEQLTSLTKHPVRYMSIADNNTLCFAYNGSIYTRVGNGDAVKVKISILTDSRNNLSEIVPVSTGATEMALSPNGKEIAFVVRGEVFVASVEGGITKRITNTPEQERSVSFSPDGRSLLYAAERGESWNVYQSTIERKEEPYFYTATVLKEVPVIATEAEEFQPAYSPDGKEVAYLEERTTLKVVNLASKATRMILPGNKNYSYSDGDQWYNWSPDGKWFLVNFMQPGRWSKEVGLIAASGKGELKNLSQSGYEESRPQWMLDGQMMVYFSNRDGMKNHGSHGGQIDAYAFFTNQEAFDRYKLTKDEYTRLTEKEKQDKEDAEKEAKAEKDKKKAANPNAKEKPLNIELEGLEERKVRLTIHSSDLNDVVLSPIGDKLYYLSKFEKGHDLWVTSLRDKETKVLAKLDGTAKSISIDKEGKVLFVLADGKITKVDAESGKTEAVKINGEMNLNAAAEREYIFEHAWRQVEKKFYVTDLHGVDWKGYRGEYARYLPHINNNYDFAEMLSEMLGELNGSHTGCRYSPKHENTDATAALGVFYDENYKGAGVKVAEVIAKGPLATSSSKVKAGTIIEKIDGVALTADTDFYQFLNRKAGKYTLLSLYDESTKKRWEETVKPITLGEQNELLYKRWVATRRAEVDRLSNGKLGYVHIRGMNDASYRVAFEEILGRNAEKEALIVDTRFNGGGWLHDDLATLLSGKQYVEAVPRGQKIGSEPAAKWTKPSVVVMSESNYSDAHFFPYAYKELNIGQLVGTPVPGTATAVWWEKQIDPTLVFGIPQVGIINKEGKYLENLQLDPDIKVYNEPEVVATGRDQQIEKAVEVLRSQLVKK